MGGSSTFLTEALEGRTCGHVLWGDSNQIGQEHVHFTGLPDLLALQSPWLVGRPGAALVLPHRETARGHREQPAALTQSQHSEV